MKTYRKLKRLKKCLKIFAVIGLIKFIVDIVVLTAFIIHTIAKKYGKS